MVNHFGEAMQIFNKELIQCIEELKATKNDLELQIEAEEAEKMRLQHEVIKMSTRISQLNESLGKKSAAFADYEHTIQETKSAYIKILESSQLLLKTVKKEVLCLDQTLGNNESTDRCSNDDTDKLTSLKNSLDYENEDILCNNLKHTNEECSKETTIII